MNLSWPIFVKFTKRKLWLAYESQMMISFIISPIGLICAIQRQHESEISLLQTSL
jgi:hypothetical protein